MEKENRDFDTTVNSGVIEKYRKKEFSEDQLEEIRLGLEHGVDVSLYADKDYFAIQMRQIRFGLEEELDVSKYLNKEYDWFQMEEIRHGLKQRVDVSVYAKPQFSYEIMRELRKALADGIHLEEYATVGADLLREMHRAILDKKNIIPYMKAGYVPEQLREIRHALNHGCNINPYLNKVYRGVAIKEIWKGLEKGINVNIYADPQYSWQQMREIRLGLEKRLDVSVYAKELYSWQQMREIRLGMEENLDIDQYKSLMYPEADMQRIRRKLKRKQVEEKKLIDDSQQPELRKQMEDYCMKNVVDTIRVFTDPVKMNAYVFVGEKAEAPSRKMLEEELASHHIKVGIDEDILEEISQGEYRNQMVTVARGIEPQRGKDGYYEYFFETDAKKNAKTLEDGSLDYEHIEWFQKVHSGQTIATYHPAQKGVNGCNVEGKVIPAIAGQEKEVLEGRGFRLSKDGKDYIAEEDGCATLTGKRLVIGRLLEVGSASTNTGDIDYNGSIHIKGDVRGNITIHVMGDIVVDGFVESAILRANGNVFIRKGTNGNDVSKITAKGNVVGRFFENVAIHAENISSNYFLRCDLYAEENITADGVNGNIAGGSVYAGNSVCVGNIGNKNGIMTQVKVGFLEGMAGIDYDQRLQETERQLDILSNALREFQKKIPPEIRNAMPEFLKIENAVYTKNQEKKQLMIEKNAQEKKKEKLREATVKVTGTMYEGTIISVNNGKYQGGTQKSVILSNKRQQVTISHI